MLKSLLKTIRPILNKEIILLFLPVFVFLEISEITADSARIIAMINSDKKLCLYSERGKSSSLKKSY